MDINHQIPSIHQSTHQKPRQIWNILSQPRENTHDILYYILHLAVLIFWSYILSRDGCMSNGCLSYKPQVVIWHCRIEPPHPSKCSACWATHNLSNETRLQVYGCLYYIDGLVQDCSNTSASAMELLQSSTKPSIYTDVFIYSVSVRYKDIPLFLVLFFCWYT